MWKYEDISHKFGFDIARERNAKMSSQREVWQVSLMFVQSNVESFSNIYFAFSIIDSRRVSFSVKRRLCEQPARLQYAWR